MLPLGPRRRGTSIGTSGSGRVTHPRRTRGCGSGRRGDSRGAASIRWSRTAGARWDFLISSRINCGLPADPPIGPNGKPADVFDVLRGLRFLGSFYVASNRRLLPSAVSEAARQAGYDPRGTGGFYTGNGCLRSDEDYRVLTQVGIDWFVSTSQIQGATAQEVPRPAGYRLELTTVDMKPICNRKLVRRFCCYMRETRRSTPRKIYKRRPVAQLGSLLLSGLERSGWRVKHRRVQRCRPRRHAIKIVCYGVK